MKAKSIRTIIKQSLEARIRELERQNETLKLDLVRFHEGVKVLYRLAHPRGLSGPDGQWHMFDEAYANTIVRMLQENLRKRHIVKDGPYSFKAVSS